MAFEKRWAEIAPLAFAADGTIDGAVTVASTDGFKVKQLVILRANTLPEATLQVKAVLSETILKVGLSSEPIHKFADITAFTIALNATIEAPEQVRPAIPDKEYERASYEEEPTVAKRVIAVDKLGRPIDSVVGIDGKVRLATDTSVSVSGISVDLDALTPATKPNPDNILIAGSEDGTKAGTKHAARVDSDLDLRVGISDGTNKAEVDVTGRVAVKDIAAQTILSAINTFLNTGTLLVDDDQTQTLLNSIIAQLQSEHGLSIGTEDGTLTGTQHVFVNNLRSMILAASDRQSVVTYLDLASKKNRRVDKIEYQSATFPGIVVRKQFDYVLSGTDYVITTPGNWSLV